MLFLWRMGYSDRRLLGGVILTTILVASLSMWRLRNAKRA
jgi:hypothetical protein